MEDKLKKFRNYLAEIDPLEALINTSDKLSAEIFIVGGIIRDFLLKRISPEVPFVEIDFAVKRDTEKLARIFAKDIGGNFILLDEKTSTFRVILKGRYTYQFDFSRFRADTIEEDLFLRDFTINAMAFNLNGLKAESALEFIDPCGGMRDLEKKEVRAVSEHSFPDDPLRIIRAFRFAVNLGFKIDPDILKCAKEYAHLLRGVSGERITEELYKIICSEDSYSWISRMDETGILEVIFPVIGEMRDVNQGPYHHLDIWRHSLEALKEFECVLAEFSHNEILSKKIKDYLDIELGGERSRLFILKLGTLFHDIGKPRAKEITEENKIRFIGHERIGAKLVSGIAENLRLSSKEKNSLERLVNLHLRPGCLVDTQDISPRAKLRFFRAAEEDSVALILLALSDKRATRGPLTTAESQITFSKYLTGVIKDYFYQKELVKPVKLLDGDQIMRILGIPPGKAVGNILDRLEEAQVEKKVNTEEEAEEFIRHMFKNNQEARGI